MTSKPLSREGWTTGPAFQLPPWASELRPAQAEAVTRALDAYDRGIELVVIDAPTGTGKTLIAECIRQGLHARARYVCTTKSLQAQFAHDFHDARVLKGRSNYRPLRGPEWITCAECTAQSPDGPCNWCYPTRDCPYRVARAQTLDAPIAVLNTAYFLASRGFKAHSTGFVVVDEADTLEAELMRHVSLDMTARQAAALELEPPDRVTVEESWLEWAGTARTRVNSVARELSNFMSERDEAGVDPDPTDIRLMNQLIDLMWRLDTLRAGLDNGTWVYAGRKDSMDIAFKPIRVDGIANRFLWDHGKRWLLMSATVISPQEMLASLGWDRPYETIAVGSGFPVKNRQIKVTPVADMSREANETDALLRGIRAIHARHPDDRILVHSVSYDLSRAIREEEWSRPVYGYTESGQRDMALRDFLATERGMLVAPSFDRGVDLPDDACRVVIIAKVPYPYLGDKQVSRRLHSPGGQTWYQVQAIRKIVQMTGRATRHADDWSVSYILDAQFGKLYREAGRLFPKWWRDAVNVRDTLAQEVGRM